MTHEEFKNWLEGFLDASYETLSEVHVAKIREKLAQVGRKPAYRNQEVPSVYRGTVVGSGDLASYVPKYL